MNTPCSYKQGTQCDPNSRVTDTANFQPWKHQLRGSQLDNLDTRLAFDLTSSRQTRPWLHGKTVSLSLGWLLLRVATALRLHHRSTQLHTIAVIVLVNGWVVELPGSSGNHAEASANLRKIQNLLSGNRASLRRDCSRLIAWQLAIMRKTSDASQNLLLWPAATAHASSADCSNE